jgi:ribosome-associated heat shock protein Hsp15
MQKTRIDKWLWAVRAFKTRTIASKACDTGKVRVNGNKVKSSFQVTTGMEISFVRVKQTYLYQVITVIDKRVAAPIAATCFKDITTPEMIAENLKENQNRSSANLPREKGLGRPTKKDRRDIDDVLSDWEEW